MKKTWTIVLTILLIGSFCIPSFAWIDGKYDVQISDLSLFSDLRAAVLAKDRDALIRFYNNPTFDGISVPLDFESAERFLKNVDEINLLTFDKDPKGLTEVKYRISLRSGTARSIYYFSGWEIYGIDGFSFSEEEKRSFGLKFTLPAADGSEVPFYVVHTGPQKTREGHYIGMMETPNGHMKIVLSPYEKDVDPKQPPLEKLGKLSYVSFAELTPPTPEEKQLGWLWVVALVVVSGSAVVTILLLRRRKKAKAVSELPAPPASDAEDSPAETP